MKSLQPPKAPITTTKTWSKTFADMCLSFLGWGDFIAALRCHYEADNELPALVIDPSIPKVSLAHCFVNLALIEQVTQERQEKALLCGEATADAVLERGELYQSLLNDGKSRGVGELFDRATLENREEPAGWVCITGRAGTGKTTLSQYITNRWGLRESLWNNRFEFVFRAKLNLLGPQNFWEGLPRASSEHYLSWLIYKSLGESSQLSLENIYDALTNRPNQILLLLDSFDEVQVLYGEDRDMRVTGLINVALQLPNGILTSRPNAIPQSFIPKFKQRFENIGLTQDNVRYYVQHYFDALSQPQLGESLLRALSTNPEMMSLAQIPVNIAALCLTWEETIASADTTGHKILT